ncbi:amino acid adenylation domain-containing protein [Catenuloplanes indicus]|uniref:Amino acid adenylation domain-containing protein n=1 Tax=Catenuloplanes indicus TaxID=137267 RepID=A0AAE4AWE8_9ACTN|nr:amino acid adenylation domain-containing protein [Catenuloplanes indicus]MDQ0364922.1 amino acid adenylation domain-containing protein [Catenuloplanes indicus]
MSGSTLFGLVAESARRWPGRVALEVGGESVTYAELAGTAALLAARLGEPAPAAVGLLASRSVAAYAGYLATLLTGATVVPLNPRAPVARNRLICRRAGVTRVVADTASAAQASELLPDGDPVRLPEGWRTSLPGPPGAGPAGPDDVAYLLFTSGSTGEPKAVPIRHRHVTGYVGHCARRYAVGPGSRLSQTFDLTFDPSVFDMFVAWSAGATLVVPEPDEILTPVRFVNRAAITHWFSVPSVISVAARFRALRPDSMPTLRWSLFAGEQLTLDAARAWARAAPRSTVENLYGPTELTVTCTGYRLPADPDAWPRTSNGTVPIGVPNPGLAAVLVGPDGTVTDDGELCMRGPQRFDGYRDPADDRGRFLRRRAERYLPVEHPETDADWYRTGDRARMEDGVLVHCGRLDDQIKIRGYRVELAEIESVLRRHPGVLEAVVLAGTGADGEVRLRAVHTGVPVPAGELAGLAGESLPWYMVPESFAHRDALPVNANGKIDRRRLAALDLEGARA